MHRAHLSRCVNLVARVLFFPSPSSLSPTPGKEKRRDPGNQVGYRFFRENNINTTTFILYQADYIFTFLNEIEDDDNAT